MHHPISFDPFCCSACIEDKRLLQAYALGSLRRVYGPVCSRGFPESGSCDSVWSCAIPIFPVPRAVEVPFFLPSTCKLYPKARSQNKILRYGEQLVISWFVVMRILMVVLLNSNLQYPEDEQTGVESTQRTRSANTVAEWS